MKKFSLSLLLAGLLLTGCVSPAATPDETPVVPIEEEEPIVIDIEQSPSEPLVIPESFESPGVAVPETLEPETTEPSEETSETEEGSLTTAEPVAAVETSETTPLISDNQGLRSQILTPGSNLQSAIVEKQVEELYAIDPDSYRIRHITDNNEPIVLLTFDDIPANDPHNRGLDIANTLKEKGANAIFFVNAGLIDSDEDRELIKTLHDMGFVIGSHTYTHPYLNEISEEAQREEIVKNNEVLKEITGEDVVFFRPPFGIYTDYTYELLSELGMVWMNWSYGYDWESDYMEAAALADIMVNTEYLGDGANLLMHERSWTADALPEIIDGLREKGYTIADPNALRKSW